MLPQLMVGNAAYNAAEIMGSEDTLPVTNTYRMDFEKKQIFGRCDSLEAMRQAVYKIICTERYQYPIYSWNYGIELAELFGKPVNYCILEIERRITEALQQDERIKAVKDFEFEVQKRGEVFVKFTVETVLGSFEMERAVKI